MNDYTLEQVSLLYYQNGMSQQEIARYLNISKMNISRMLQKARDTDIVQISVKLPFAEDAGTARKLEKLFGLEQAVVAKIPSRGKSFSLRGYLGGIAAFYMMLETPGNTVYGMGIGETIGQVVENLLPLTTENVHVVQLMGGLSTVSQGNPFSIIQETCRKFSSQGTYLTSYAVLESKQACQDVMNHDIRTTGVYDLWKKCNEAYFGIGSINTGTFFAESLKNSSEWEGIIAQGTVGDILGHCYDQEGNFLQTAIEERLVSIPVDMLRNIKKRVAISGGVEKAPAVLGALRSGIVTHLIIDEETAGSIVTKT